MYQMYMNIRVIFISGIIFNKGSYAVIIQFIQLFFTPERVNYLLNKIQL